MATFAQIERVLRKTKMGVIALAIHSRKNVQLAYTNSGPPASYRADINTCTLNTALPLLIVAAYFVHEMHHAIRHLTGRSADPKQLDKSTYVARMLAEEAKGTALGYEAFLELEELGFADDQPAPPNFHYYRSAYKAGREKAQRENGNLSESDLHATPRRGKCTTW